MPHCQTPTFSRWSWLFSLLALVLASCDSRRPAARLGPDGQPLERVTLMLNWYPEAEHGGFYAAQVHGIFERHGLDVDIRAGGPNAPVAQELMTGRVQFAIGNADDVLLFRQEQAPVVALMAPLQNTPRCVLVRADSEVTSLTQLAGLTLQANVGRPFLNFLEHQGLLKDVKIVPYAGSVANFVADRRTAIQAYSFSEPLLAHEQGVETRCLMLSEIGFNPYASCLITTEDYLRQQPELIGRMVLACREGWQHYLESPAETNALILQLNPHGMSGQALEFGVQALRPLCLPEGMGLERVGEMSLDRWRILTDQFSELGLISGDRVQPESLFTTEFLTSRATEPAPVR